jgi:hypothetical protein
LDQVAWPLCPGILDCNPVLSAKAGVTKSPNCTRSSIAKRKTNAASLLSTRYRAGWKPYVIGEDEARDHPLYNELREKFSTLPTVNDKFYELQCYLRWVAMANLGGGFMADYDILNYGFPPPPALELDGPCGRGPLTSYENLMPMLVAGDADAYIHLAKLFADYQVGRRACCWYLFDSQVREGKHVVRRRAGTQVGL